MGRSSLVLAALLVACGGESTATTAATEHVPPDGGSGLVTPDASASVRDAGTVSPRDAGVTTSPSLGDAACVDAGPWNGETPILQCFSEDELLPYGITHDSGAWTCPTIDELQPRFLPCAVSEGSCCTYFLCGPEAREVPPDPSVADSAPIHQCCYLVRRICGV